MFESNSPLRPVKIGFAQVHRPFVGPHIRQRLRQAGTNQRQAQARLCWRVAAHPHQLYGLAQRPCATTGRGARQVTQLAERGVGTPAFLRPVPRTPNQVIPDLDKEVTPKNRRQVHKGARVGREAEIADRDDVLILPPVFTPSHEGIAGAPTIGRSEVESTIRWRCCIGNLGRKGVRGRGRLRHGRPVQGVGGRLCRGESSLEILREREAPVARRAESMGEDFGIGAAVRGQDVDLGVQFVALPVQPPRDRDEVTGVQPVTSHAVPDGLSGSEYGVLERRGEWSRVAGHGAIVEQGPIRYAE